MKTLPSLTQLIPNLCWPDMQTRFTCIYTYQACTIHHIHEIELLLSHTYLLTMSRATNNIITLAIEIILQTPILEVLQPVIATYFRDNYIPIYTCLMKFKP